MLFDNGTRIRVVSEKPILAQTLVEGRRIVIYDAARLPAPTPDRFVAANWPDPVLLDGGRGHTYAVRGDFGEAVLRRYRRGGAIARYLGDRYLWSGIERARPIAEFKLLVAAHAAGLRVPRPLAAQVQREGMFYTGDLMMARIAGQKLSSALDTMPDWSAFHWAALGNSIGKVHAAGFEHADLNAHNVLIDTGNRVWLIDWDRGSRRDPKSGNWPQANLNRLQRSLHKVFGARMRAPGADAGWAALVEAHARALRTGPPTRKRPGRRA